MSGAFVSTISSESVGASNYYTPKRDVFQAFGRNFANFSYMTYMR